MTLSVEFVYSLLFIERNYKSLNLSSLLFIERKWRLCNKDKPIYLLHLSQQNVVALSRMQRFMVKYSMSQLPSLSRVGYWDMEASHIACGFLNLEVCIYQ